MIINCEGFLFSLTLYEDILTTKDAKAFKHLVILSLINNALEEHISFKNLRFSFCKI